MATVPGPMATLLAPTACESGSVELAWKYLMPEPPETAATSGAIWLTFTASVACVPPATLVIWRSAPAAPTDTSPTLVMVVGFDVVVLGWLASSSGLATAVMAPRVEAEALPTTTPLAVVCVTLLPATKVLSVLTLLLPTA